MERGGGVGDLFIPFTLLSILDGSKLVGNQKEYGRRRIGFGECGKWVIRLVLWFCFDICCTSCILRMPTQQTSVKDMYQRLTFTPFIVKIAVYICGPSLKHTHTHTLSLSLSILQR